MSTLIQIILAATTIFAVSLGLIIYTRSCLTYTRKLLIIHFFSIAGWALCTLIVLRQELIWAAMGTYACALLIVVSKTYFISAFPGTKPPERLSHLLPLFIASLFLLLSFQPGLFFTDFKVVDGYYVDIKSGPLCWAYVVVVTGFIVYPIVDLIRKMRSPKHTGNVAEQIRFLFLGVTFFFLLGLATNSILPVAFDIYYFNGVGPSLSLILAGFIIYIISTHNFLGLSLAVQRGFIYSVLLSGIVALYVTILFTLETFSHRHPLSTPLLSGLVTTIISIFSVPYIDSWLRHLTDSFFFKKRYNYSQVVYEISEALNRSLELSAIKKLVRETLQQQLKVSQVTITLNSQSKSGQSANTVVTPNHNNQLTVPLTSGATNIGKLAVSSKLSDEAYTKDDLKLLETISYHLALACERAELHQQLKKYAEELESKVEKRTSELKQAYDHQQAMLSNIAHGLQTPLTVIEGELNNLRLDKKLTDSLSVLEKSLSSISTYIRDLLRLARLESDVAKIEPTQCNVTDLLTEICTYTKLLATDRSITLIEQLENQVYLHIDVRKIEEAILILISNAFKYIGPNRPKVVTVRLQQSSDHTTIEVSDTGIGIAEADLPKLFDRFYRVRDQSTRAIPGSGLGLSIARAIIDKHNGTITVSSVKNIGTTFTISLPRPKPPAVSDS